MPLPERSHPDTATGTEPNRVQYDVITASPSGDSHLEFLPEEPDETAVKQRVFVIEPIPQEPPREQRPQQQPGRTRNVPAGVGIRFLRLLHPRTALVALYRAVMWPFWTLYRGVVGTFLLLRRVVVGTFSAVHLGVAATLVALRRGVMGTGLALRRIMVRTSLLVYRGVAATLVALRRGVVGTGLALRRIMVGTSLAVYRGVAATLVALRRGVVGTGLALRRIMVGTSLAVYRGVAGTLVALRRGVVGTGLALRRIMVGTSLAVYRGVAGTLVALRRGVVGTGLALRRGISLACVGVRQTTSGTARWTWNSCVRLIEGTTSIGLSGVARLRHVGGDVTARGRAIWKLSGVGVMLVRGRLAREIRALGGVISMVGRHVSVMSRSLLASLRLLGRSASQVAYARPLRVRVRLAPLQPLRMRLPSRQSLGMRIPSWALKTPGVRVPGMNLTLVAFTGGTALGALVMWFFGVQANVPGLTDRTAARAAAAPPAAVVLEPFANAYVATAGIVPFTPQETGTATPAIPEPMTVVSSGNTVAPIPAAATLPAMTVTSTPEGARVTVDGIGWGETPVTIRHLSPGQKVVRLTKEGYVSQQQIISVPADRRSAAVRVTLRARN